MELIMIKIYIHINDLNRLAINPHYIPTAIWLDRNSATSVDLVEMSIPLDKWESWKHVIKYGKLWD